MNIVICIPTFRRPDSLTRLLRAIESLDVSVPVDGVRVLVVDNDPEGSATSTVEAHRAAPVRYPVEVVTEPKRGISQARNRALDWSLAQNADAIVFIDDDEIPDALWLDELLRTQQAHDASAVAGPVLSEFEHEVPAWITEGGFFDRARRPTGARLDRAGTGNALILLSVLRMTGVRFDERLGLVGGEDQMLFRSLHALGHPVVWADEAFATEIVPASRARLGWIMRRAYRYGATTTHIDMRLGGTVSGALRNLCIGMYRIFKGVLLLVASLLGGRVMRATALRHITYGAGHMAGVFGRLPQEYGTIHGG